MNLILFLFLCHSAAYAQEIIHSPFKIISSGLPYSGGDILYESKTIEEGNDKITIRTVWRDSKGEHMYGHKMLTLNNQELFVGLEISKKNGLYCCSITHIGKDQPLKDYFFKIQEELEKEIIEWGITRITCEVAHEDIKRYSELGYIPIEEQRTVPHFVKMVKFLTTHMPISEYQVTNHQINLAGLDNFLQRQS